MKEIPYVKAWFAFFLVATIGGFVAGMIIGFMAGAVLGMMGVDLNFIRISTGALGFIVSVPISYMCFRWSVGRYIVPSVLLSTDDSPTQE